MKDELARMIGELMYLRDNEKDYFVRNAYIKKIKAIDELMKLTPNEVNVL